MGAHVDITGQRFGKWTVEREVGRSASGLRYVIAVCECGTKKRVIKGALTSGKSKSCGKHAKPGAWGRTPYSDEARANARADRGNDTK
jgi:hypothetical protein